jgi:hypothetical protein
MSLERFQKEVVRGTFQMAQGRQWLQICCLDAIFRLLARDGVHLDWQLLGGEAARARVRMRQLPPGHAPVDVPDQVGKLFELWLQIAVWIGQYVYEHDARWLPSHDQLDALVHDDLALEAWVSSATEEETAGMKLMFDRYRTRDPHALLTVEQVVREFTLPYWIKGDRHWVSGARARPGVLRDPHGSMILHLVRESHRMRSLGWQLTATDRLCAMVGDTLIDLERVDPRYATLPAYRKLIREYNAAHPGAEVRSLHR